MSEHQSGPGERVVITASELERVESRASPVIPRNPPSPKVPWWGLLTGSLLVVCLPLLCGFAAGMRIALRNRAAAREAWTRLFCTLLIVSGLLTSIAVAYVWTIKAPPQVPAAQFPLGLVSHDLAEFPVLPAASPLSAAEIAARTRLLVFIVIPDPGGILGESDLDSSPVGAAALLMANDSGYLLATNRHVADAQLLFRSGNVNRVLVASSQGSYAYADVVGRHQSLDLALLWVRRRVGHSTFRQPVLRYSAIVVGSPVFVIGHPQRLFFTLSSGMVSRLGGDGTVQLSAPISPGNSGGPTYDSSGNLLGIVTSTIDKQINPNAENLNFATRADALLTASGWNFREGGRASLDAFLQ